MSELYKYNLYEPSLHKSKTNKGNAFRLSSDYMKEPLGDSLDNSVYASNAISLGTLYQVPQNNTITFSILENEVLRFEENGDIYINGRLAENDSQVVQGMRQLLSGQGLL